MTSRLPRRLFKYFPPSRIALLIDPSLRFTQPGDFNDPFEVRTPFGAKFDDEDLVEQATVGMKKFALSVLNASGLHNNISDAAKEAIVAQSVSKVKPALLQDLRAGHDALFAKLGNEDFVSGANKSLGILCLTETATNLLMWGHYAESYAGFVVEFEPTHKFFSCPPAAHKDVGTLTRVHYDHYRPKIVLNGTGDHVRDLLFSKAKDWQYEQEWRLVRLLKIADDVCPRSPFDVHLFRIPPSAIKAVIVGHRMSRQNFEKLQTSLAMDANRHVALNRIQIHESRYALTIESVRHWEELNADASRAATASMALAELHRRAAGALPPKVISR